MISLKYLELRHFKDSSFSKRKEVMSLIKSDDLKKCVNQIISEECQREKVRTLDKHSRKFKNLEAKRCPSLFNNDSLKSPQEHSENQKVEHKNGIVVRAAGIFTDKCFPLLEKGANYKLTPSKNVMIEQLKVGIARTAIAMRYANPVDRTTTRSRSNTVSIHEESDSNETGSHRDTSG